MANPDTPESPSPADFDERLDLDLIDGFDEELKLEFEDRDHDAIPWRLSPMELGSRRN